MTAATLLRELRSAGVSVRVAGDRLALRGPLTPALTEAVHRRKPELMAMLAPVCRCCGAGARAAELGGYDLLGWRCDACLDRAGLLPWRTLT